MWLCLGQKGHWASAPCAAFYRFLMWPSPVFFASGKWVSGIVSSERNCALSFTLCQVYRFDMHARRLLKTLFCHYSTFTGLAYACLYSSPDAANHSRTRRLLRPRQHTHTHTHTHTYTHTHTKTHTGPALAAAYAFPTADG